MKIDEPKFNERIEFSVGLLANKFFLDKFLSDRIDAV